MPIINENNKIEFSELDDEICDCSVDLSNIVLQLANQEVTKEVFINQWNKIKSSLKKAFEEEKCN